MTTPVDPHTRQYSHINGSTAELLDRLAVQEICKGWPVYRDASEWKNFRALFSDVAYVWTTWSGPRTVDDFIQISKDGKANGAFIQHRECGTLAEVNRATGRAVGKMKATITQRFVSEDGIAYDVDCDCRFLFFCEREDAVVGSATGAWRAKYVKLIYEKDKLIPVDGVHVPTFDAQVLDRLPEGYKFLGAAQAALGYEIDLLLATVQDHGSYFRMYACMEKWLAGRDPELFWEEPSAAPPKEQRGEMMQMPQARL